MFLITHQAKYNNTSTHRVCRITRSGHNVIELAICKKHGIGRSGLRPASSIATIRHFIIYLNFGFVLCQRDDTRQAFLLEPWWVFFFSTEAIWPASQLWGLAQSTIPTTKKSVAEEQAAAFWKARDHMITGESRDQAVQMYKAINKHWVPVAALSTFIPPREK